MGRVKLEIRKIENPTNRQVTYSKRRNGLIKKAYELSVLCDIDIALIMFSPSGRLNHFSGCRKRIEDVISRFASLSDHERAKSQCIKWFEKLHPPPKIQNPEILFRAVKKLRQETFLTPSENSSSHVSSLEIQGIQYEIQRTQVQIQNMENRLRMYEGDLKGVSSMQELENFEKNLQNALEVVQMGKQTIELINHRSQFKVPRSQMYAEILQSKINPGHQYGGMFQCAPNEIIHDWLSRLRSDHSTFGPTQCNYTPHADINSQPHTLIGDLTTTNDHCLQPSVALNSPVVYSRALTCQMSEFLASNPNTILHEGANNVDAGLLRWSHLGLAYNNSNPETTGPHCLQEMHHNVDRNVMMPHPCRSILHYNNRSSSKDYDDDEEAEEEEEDTNERSNQMGLHIVPMRVLGGTSDSTHQWQTSVNPTGHLNPVHISQAIMQESQYVGGNMGEAAT